MKNPSQKATAKKPATGDGVEGGIGTGAPIATSPAPAFPVDARPAEEPRRGPGRPPNKCATCGKLSSECKGHVIQFGEDSVKGMLQMFSHFVALSVSLSAGLPGPAMSQVWKFSDGELALIAPPAAEVLNDVLPAWMVTWEKELKLGFVLLPILISKMTVTHALITAHKASQKKEQPANVSPSPAAIPISEGRSQAAVG